MGRNQENGKEKYSKMKTFEIEKVFFFPISSSQQFLEDFAKTESADSATWEGRFLSIASGVSIHPNR